MSLALLRTTFKLSRWSIIGWIVFLALYSLFVIWLFPSISDNEGIEAYMRSLPESLLASLGITPKIMDQLFTNGGYSLNGFLVTEYLSWWPVMVGIYGFMFGSGIVARESERGTMELLLSHPIPRHTIVTSKFLGFILILAAIVIGSLIGIVGGLLVTGLDASVWRLFLVLVQAGLLVAAIAAYSTLVSCLVVDPRRAMTISGGLMVASYILNLMAPALGNADWLVRFSIFYYFKPFEALLQGEFALDSAAVYLGLTAACYVAALLMFQRRKAVV